MKKLFIKNRHDKKIAVIIEKPDQPIGLAFVMHGFGGMKSTPHLETFAKVFFNNNYIVIRFDVTHTYGESEGNYEDATTTNYYEDLEDVINWSKSQAWYQEPFILGGHSTGGTCTALYAEKYPKEIKALAPISVLVSGELYLKDCNREELAESERTGWQIRASHSQPGIIKKLKWQPYVKDLVKHDLLPEVNKLTMPILLIVGELDDVCPLAHQEILFNALPTVKKELHIIQGAPHTFRDENHLQEIYSIMDKWLKTLN
jgi:pimeloyl-ACP methyl ester carboxylesterase